jgi:tRNA dimethylallyltransferase
MFTNGLVDEVRGLIPLGIERGVTASRAIGYAQALGVIHGTMTETEAIAETALLTRKFARRQVGWFGRNPQIRWFDSPASATDALAVFDSWE